mgnify:CR=1 FL=1
MRRSRAARREDAGSVRESLRESRGYAAYGIHDMSLSHTIRFITNHPLCQDRRIAALSRFASWQIRCRLSPGPHEVPFVNSTRLSVTRGMFGATGNIYCGLHEFEDMAFVLHLLRKEDLFVDVGSNVGSYTVLASGAVGAQSIAVEPLKATFDHLMSNVRCNRIESLVTALNVGVAESSGTKYFTTNYDTMNHIAESADGGNTTQIQVQSLDEIIGDRTPTCIKVDVEGYERQVLTGGAKTFANPHLLAVLVEVNETAERYDDGAGFDTHRRLSEFGLTPCVYHPFERRLEKRETPNNDGNTLYIRDLDAAAKRVAQAPKFRVLNHEI